ncbi:MAG: hypothetical protein ACTSXQ_04880 [Alphaproteobacteria bacterium]
MTLEKIAITLCEADGRKHYKRFNHMQSGKIKNKYLSQAKKLEEMGLTIANKNQVQYTASPFVILAFFKNILNQLGLK